MGRLVEGVWDCPYCGTDRIRGLLHKCPHCGRQRDNTIKFYLADPKNYVDEQTENGLRYSDFDCRRVLRISGMDAAPSRRRELVQRRGDTGICQA